MAGLAHTPEYRSWYEARRRTIDPSCPSWHNYGGRGIRMCPEWLDDFAAFLAHVGPRPAGTSIDRIDNDGDYRPGNVRWATPVEQGLNRRPRTPEHASALSAASALKARTHCPAGHPYSGHNLIVRRDRHRECRKCLAARTTAYRRRRRTEVAA